MAHNEDKAASGTEEKPKGLFGRVFRSSGKRFKAAKMGMELQMYYHEEVRSIDQ